MNERLEAIQVHYLDPAPGLAKIHPVDGLAVIVPTRSQRNFYATPLEPWRRSDHIVHASRFQSSLGITPQYQWIRELHPTFAEQCEMAKLAVREMPMLSMDISTRPPDRCESTASVRFARIACDDSTLDQALRIGSRAFSVDGAPRQSDVRESIPRWVIEKYRTRLRSETLAVVATRGASIIGIASANLAINTAEIVGVGVVPEERREGVGTRLVSQLLHELNDAGITIAFGQSVEPGATRMYNQCGFEATGTAAVATPIDSSEGD